MRWLDRRRPRSGSRSAASPSGDRDSTPAIKLVERGPLAAADGDHHSAFAQYERELRDYVRKGQRLAKGNAAGLIPRSRTQVWLRSRFIRALPYLPWRRLGRRRVQKAATAITLKSYHHRDR